MMMWFVFFATAVGVVYLRGTAGFCGDPHTAIENILAKNESDPGQYYATCSTYTWGERVTYWPWETDRLQASEEFQNIDTNVTLLSTQWQGNATSMNDLVVQSRELGCQVSTNVNMIFDYGILSTNSVLKCGTGNRLVEALLDALCDETYTPIEQIVACMFLFALAMLCCICNQQWLRRETNGNDGWGSAKQTYYEDYGKMSSTSV